MMPIAYMKRNPEVNRLLTEHPEHFICCEKYTMQNGFFDIESNCLGAYLGGYAGNYGIRFDDCGWSPSDGNDATEKRRRCLSFRESSRCGSYHGTRYADGADGDRRTGIDMDGCVA